MGGVVLCVTFSFYTSLCLFNLCVLAWRRWDMSHADETRACSRCGCRWGSRGSYADVLVKRILCPLCTSFTSRSGGSSFRLNFFRFCFVFLCERQIRFSLLLWHLVFGVCSVFGVSFTSVSIPPCHAYIVCCMYACVCL